MSILLEVESLIDQTILSLDRAKFTKDPIAGTHFSKLVSVMSSAYKRHGFILEEALFHALRRNPIFEVWRDDKFPVSQSADQMVSAALNDPEPIFSVNLPQGTTVRTLQVDLLVYNKDRKELSAYEVKRGNGLHDAGKKRSMIRDTLCTQILLKSYGEQRGFKIDTVKSRIIFYYGKCSVGAPWAIKGKDLDEHFGVPILAVVEEVNEHFRKKLFSILSA